MFTNNATLGRLACSVSDMTTSELDVHRDELRNRGEDVAVLTEKLENARVLLRSAVLDALAAGISELEASKLAGVTRDSVRRWAGK